MIAFTKVLAVSCPSLHISYVLHFSFYPLKLISGSKQVVVRLNACVYYAIILSVSAGEDQPNSEKVEVKVDGHSATGTVKSDCGNRLQRLCCCLHMTAVHLRTALWGVAVVICICISWSGCTQMAKITVRRLNVPFTLTWFSTSWNCAIFPIYYLGHLCFSKDRQTPRQRFR